MKSNTHFRFSVLFLAVLVIWPIAEAQAASGSFEKSITVDEPIQLDVRTGSGKITIESGTSGRIEVVGHISTKRGFFSRSSKNAEEAVRLFESEPPVELVDGQLLIGHYENNKYGRNVTINYDIIVPREIQVASHTGSGSQTISGVTGPVEVSTGSGSIKLDHVGGPVEASSGSGSIRAEGVAGAFQAHSGSGSIRMDQVSPGDVDVSCGSGNIVLDNVVGELSAHTGSGKIVVDGLPTGSWTLDSGSGTIKITFPDDAAFELDARAHSGSINVDHPLTIRGTVSKKRLSGEVRGGGPLIEIETGSGNIRIDERLSTMSSENDG